MTWTTARAEPYRITAKGYLFTTEPGQPYGAFTIPIVGDPQKKPELGKPGKQTAGRLLRILAADGDDSPDDPCAEQARGWQHVSVSVPRKGERHDPHLPTWAEMCLVKTMFWGLEDVVVQYHPRESEYVDNWPCLHLWRNTVEAFPTPDPVLVGWR